MSLHQLNGAVYMGIMYVNSKACGGWDVRTLSLHGDYMYDMYGDVHVRTLLGITVKALE